MTNPLIYVGLRGRVAALHRETGELVWNWKSPLPFRGQCVTLLLDGDRLIVSISGYMHALDAGTGSELWSNNLPGFGIGVTSLASARSAVVGIVPPFAADRQC
ncbi:MAG: PQQ-binding-like beta-propeller repeat protein [Planctomycetes bacterium]|nr:PQQ-binding-like beta-propeller repeat protein [Planctomycetota bacterium]